MSLLRHLVNRQREVEVVRRNAALPPATKEASNRTHTATSPVPASHAGEESKIDVGTPAEQLAVLLKHYGSERYLAKQLNLYLPDVIRLGKGAIDQLPNDGQASRLEKAARAFLKK